MGNEFNERKAELQAEGAWNLKKLIRFAFGNTHEDIKPKDAKQS